LFVVVVSASRKRNSKKLLRRFRGREFRLRFRFVFRRDLVFGGPFNNSDFANLNCKSELPTRSTQTSDAFRFRFRWQKLNMEPLLEAP
jgi:hypothetical protein